MYKLTKEDIVGELRSAAECAEDSSFNEDSIPEAIDFMFDTYCDYDAVESDGGFDDMDEDEIPTKEEWKDRVEKAKKELEETDAITDGLIIDELSAGLDNNYDEISEGGSFSSIGEIILEDDEDDEDDEEDDDDEDDEEDEKPAGAGNGRAKLRDVSDFIDDVYDKVYNAPGFNKDSDDLMLRDLCEEVDDLLEEWNEGTGRDEYKDAKEYVKARFDVDKYVKEWTHN